MELWLRIRHHILNPKEADEASDRMRYGSRWAMEFARNLVAVAGLQYLAQFSENPILIAIAFCAFLALFFYCVSYLHWFTPSVFPSIRNRNTRALMVVLLLTIVGLTGMTIVYLGLRSAIDEIVHLQQHPKPSKPDGMQL